MAVQIYSVSIPGGAVKGLKFTGNERSDLYCSVYTWFSRQFETFHLDKGLISIFVGSLHGPLQLFTQHIYET